MKKIDLKTGGMPAGLLLASLVLAFFPYSYAYDLRGFFVAGDLLHWLQLLQRDYHFERLVEFLFVASVALTYLMLFAPPVIGYAYHRYQKNSQTAKGVVIVLSFLELPASVLLFILMLLSDMAIGFGGSSSRGLKFTPVLYLVPLYMMGVGFTFLFLLLSRRKNILQKNQTRS